jgi:iron(III) transport system permease protein
MNPMRYELPRNAARAFGLGIFLLVAFLVVYPIGLLIYQSFQVGAFGTPTSWGLDNWHTALTTPAMREAIINTLSLTAARQTISFIVGMVIAWLLARTDIPGAHWLEFGFWIAFFIPALSATLGWILLLDPDYGLINKLFLSLPFIEEPPFNIFSWWGIVFAHLMTGSIAIKVMLLTPAFRNMDGTLEEAARVSGVGTLGTLCRIVMPIMAPTILVVFLMGTIRSMEAFEIELILGSPPQIDVYSTLIYRQIFDVQPQYGTATAMSMMVLILLLPFILLQQVFSRRRNQAVVGGKFAVRVHRLGTWRWPAFAAIAFLLLLIAVLPVTLIVAGTFMKIFGYFTLPSGAFTLANWDKALHNPNLLLALIDTVAVATGAAFLAMVLYSVIAYLSVRSRLAFPATLDFLTWLPSTIPGIVIGLGFLWLFLGTPIFRPLYGTPWVLMLAIVLGGMTTGVQVIKSNIAQIGKELEEAAAVSGSTPFHVFCRVLLPLIAPAVLVVGLLVFASAARATSLVALLATGAIKPLSMLQLNYMADGSYELATVVGVIILTLTIGVALIARLVSLRFGAAGGAATET